MTKSSDREKWDAASDDDLFVEEFTLVYVAKKKDLHKTTDLITQAIPDGPNLSGDIYIKQISGSGPVPYDDFFQNPPRPMQEDMQNDQPK